MKGERTDHMSQHVLVEKTLQLTSNASAYILYDLAIKSVNDSLTRAIS